MCYGKCESPGTSWCRTTQQEKFRNERCSHRWCLCNGDIWSCCTCQKLNLWGDCIKCRNVRCHSCVSMPRSNQRSLDRRYVEWKRQYDAQGSSCSLSIRSVE
ncbi:hypothetical protein F4823DRAFT_629032 [Ustulina deusta]|nr:hypothetical protein F4823DRAFT_629032 [Ustulina deusta]